MSNNKLKYYSEGDGVEYEIWQDITTLRLYRVPISIERDFDGKEPINKRKAISIEEL